MFDGDRKAPGFCLHQTPSHVRLRLGGQLDLLLARGTRPSGEPFRRQVRLCGAESPGAGPDEDLRPQPAEFLAGHRNGVRAEQTASRRRATLVGIKCRGHAAVQWIRRGQVDATDDGQGQ